jgi:hypothetical protein
VAIKVRFTYTPSLAAWIEDLLGYIGVFGLGCLLLAGPIIAMDLLAFARIVHSRFCARCGYDLTGNVSGVCSECGTRIVEGKAMRPSAGQRIAAIPWRTFLPAYAAVVILLLAAAGYVKVTEAYICSECGKHEYRLIHEIRLPFGGPLLFEIGGGIRENWSRPNPLTPYLDPDGTCRHNWVGLGCSGEGLTFGWRGIGADPSASFSAIEPDLGTFLHQNPGVLDRIRADLRKRWSIREWLWEEYAQWKGYSP